jgi:CBS domain-containing protein
MTGELEANALRILREVPGLTVVAEPRGKARWVDAILQFGDLRARVAIEFKGRANAATAWQLIQHAKALPDTALLVVADETTAEARAILEQHGIGVVDGLGNAHIELPGLLIHLEGRQQARRPSKPAPTRLRGKAGLAAQALLVHRDKEWQVRDLAEEAGVSVGLAHRVLARLENEGIVISEGAGPKRVRRMSNPTALLDLWTEEQDEHATRTPGFLLARGPRELIRRLAGNLEHAEIEYALTGSAGASLVAPFVTAIPVVELWVRSTASPEELHAGAGTQPVTDGQNVVFLQTRYDGPRAYRERTDDGWVANRFRLYADLRRDPRRGREQAEHLRTEVIGF